ncbi:carbohydrate ABC transporter substrate-binding protein (CUT1 family) [Halanaerobium saccharolyticum]|uniref:Carbohydrate ABC transporter substrate-binding protein (CUT1 family) n=2 Tax=Halanaerobium saccharolyticum TaxID=43595 RepID=A0A4R6M2W0_9FIRM|nr:carbohydrate ABC transporter substrate-binding protein (CUT1 family) [Halanaerobium saccharolyticum]
MNYFANDGKKGDKMRKNIILLTFLLIVLVSISVGAEDIVLNYYSHGVENGTRMDIIEEFEATHPGIKVNLVELPQDTNKKLQMINTILQSQDNSMDIFDSDVTWPPIFAAAGWVEPLDGYLSEVEMDDFLPGPVGAVTYMGKVWGVPYRTDAGMLYYRKDLLEKHNKEVPKTWDELIETSRYIMEREEGIKGHAGSWAQYEGLTCNLMEFVWSYGGKVFNEEGEVVYNSPETVAAVSTMTDMINKDNIMPNGIVNFYSGDARAPFFSGKLVFLRDWPSGWRKSQNPDNSQVVGKVGIAALPMGSPDQRSYSTLGGWQVMVSKYSDHKEEAVEFAKFRGGKEAQKMAALGLSHIPARESLYSDSDILEKMPFIEDMFPAFVSAYPRPKSPYYAEVSNILQVETQKAFVEDKTAAEAVKDADQRIKDLLGQ